MAEHRHTNGMAGPASWVAFGALLLAGLWLIATTFAPLWKPLLIAAVLAAATNSWHAALRRRLGGRPRLAAAIMTVAVVILVLVPLAIVAGVLAQQAVEAVAYLSAALRQGGLDELASRLPDRIEGPARDLAQRLNLADGGLSEQAAAGGWQVVNVVRGLLEAATRALFGLIMLLIAYYALLLDGKRLVSWIQKALPLPSERTSEMVAEFRHLARSVLGSTVASAAAQALTASVGYIIAGVPNVLFFSAVTLIVGLIPVLGTPMVALPLAALLLAQGDIWQGIFLAAYAVVIVSSVDNIVKPWVVRGSMEMHGVLLFFTLIGGVLAFGAIGIIMGPLSLTLLLTLPRLARGQPIGRTNRHDHRDRSTTT